MPVNCRIDTSAMLNYAEHILSVSVHNLAIDAVQPVDIFTIRSSKRV